MPLLRKDVPSALLCPETGGHGPVMRMAAFGGRAASLLEGLGPPRDESGLIFVMDGALSRHSDRTRSGPCGNGPGPGSFHSV